MITGAHEMFTDIVRIERPDTQPHERTPDPTSGVIPDPAMTVTYEGPCAFFAPSTDEIAENGQVNDQARVAIICPNSLAMPGPTDVATIVRWSRQPQHQGERLDLVPGPLMTHDVVTEFVGVLKPRSG